MQLQKKACQKFKHIPVSIVNFAEGTRFDKKKHAKQQSPYKNLLKPRAGGVAMVLDTMGEYLDGIVDVTLHYPGATPTIWDFLSGKTSIIKISIKTIKVTQELLGDYNDDNYQLK